MLTIMITLMGGLGLFIAGMNMMSKGIEKVAGTRLRSILAAFTKNKLLAIVVGCFFTAVIQSSSAATVMVVSFVSAGLMTLSEAVGIILGANIGTTVTALLVAIRLNAIAPVFVLCGAIMANFIKQPTVRKLGEVVLGFGILFVGISTMSSAMAELRQIPSVTNALAAFTNPVLGILLGTVITSVVQSSSVTVSILVVMASQGLVDLPICMFVILGCNIGACTSAVLSSLNGTKDAKRAALIHLLFNVYGTVLMFVLLSFFSEPIAAGIRFLAGGGTDAGSLGRQIAVAHLTFKVFQVIVFYPFTELIVKSTYLFVRGDDKAPEDSQFHVQFLTDRLPNPAVGTYLAVQEMDRMAQMAFQNLNLAVECFLHVDEEKVKQVAETEKYIDYLEGQISDFLVHINQNTLPLKDMERIAAYFHVVSDIERIGDHAQNIAELAAEMKARGSSVSDESAAELRDMMTSVNRILKESLDMFVTGNPQNMQDIILLEDKIDRIERELENKHIVRLSEGKCTAQTGVFFSDVVSGLERVSDHAINIAFSLNEVYGYVPQD